MKAFKFFVVFGIGLLALTACGKKGVKQEQSRASNRTMGYVLKLDPSLEPQRATYTSWIDNGLTDAYAAKTKGLSFEPNSLLEDAENLYQIARNQADDIFIFSMNSSGSSIEVSGTIYSGANLKPIAVIRTAVGLEDDPDKDEEDRVSLDQRFKENFKKVLLNSYPNPNIYPVNAPFHFANLLFVYAESQEKSLKEPLSCINAPEILKYYPRAKEIYELGKGRAIVRAVGSQSEEHLINTRIQDATEKSKVLQLCIEDAKKSFELNWDFGTIDPANHSFILKAAENAGLEAMLKQYTNKPTALSMQLQPTGEIITTLTIQFDPVRYKTWTKGRVAEKYGSFGILSLDPYHALMQKLVVFKNSLPAESNPALRQSFNLMKLNLMMTTILNGEVLLGIDGKYDSKTKSIAMAYPNSLFIQAPGFDRKLINGRDKELFQEKTWIALGNCKTIDGTPTEDGLVYKFFGLTCP